MVYALVLCRRTTTVLTGQSPELNQLPLSAWSNVSVPSRRADRSSRSVADLDVADDSPCPNLELGTIGCFHADALIPEERAATRDHSGPRRYTQPDIPYQVEDPKDGAICRRTVAEVHPHVADEEHYLLVGPSNGKGVLGHIAEEREHRRPRRRAPGLARPPDPEPAC